MIKTTNYTLLVIFFISAMSYADSPIQEQVTLPSIIDVISFCSIDKTCTSVTPVIAEEELKYDVKYETDPIITDPREEEPDD